MPKTFIIHCVVCGKPRTIRSNNRYQARYCLDHLHRIRVERLNALRRRNRARKKKRTAQKPVLV